MSLVCDADSSDFGIGTPTSSLRDLGETAAKASLESSSDEPDASGTFSILQIHSVDE